MQVLEQEHDHIRVLASRELNKFGINMKLKKLTSKKKSPKNRCYAVPLNRLETVDVKFGLDVVPIPKIFHDLVEFIRRDMKVEGMFRKEGSKVKEKRLVKLLDEGGQLPEETSIIEACAVTKIFLRNIPGNLIPGEYSAWFTEAGKLPKDAPDALHLCVLLLPLENLYLLVYLLQFFNDITSYSSQNKMDPFNMAVVAAPNIFPPITKGNLQVQGEMSNTIVNITKIMIERAKTYTSVPVALISKLEQYHEEEVSKRRVCA